MWLYRIKIYKATQPLLPNSESLNGNLSCNIFIKVRTTHSTLPLSCNQAMQVKLVFYTQADVTYCSDTSCHYPNKRIQWYTGSIRQNSHIQLARTFTNGDEQLDVGEV